MTKLLCEGPRRQRSCILRDDFQLMPEQSRHLNFIRALQGTEHRRIFLGFMFSCRFSVPAAGLYCTALHLTQKMEFTKHILQEHKTGFIHNNQAPPLQTQGSQTKLLLVESHWLQLKMCLCKEQRMHTQTLQAHSRGPAEPPAALHASTYISCGQAIAECVQTSFEHHTHTTQAHFCRD